MSKQIQPVDDCTKTCADCGCFARCSVGGICVNADSDHCHHVLSQFHSTCEVFWEPTPIVTATVPAAGAEAEAGGDG